MYDVLRRSLKINGFEVSFVENITDVEDKIIKRALEKSITAKELTDVYSKVFFEDIAKLDILPADNYPKATEHVGEMIKFIETLIEKKLAYEKDGSVYFDISAFPKYGRLVNIDPSNLKTGTRVLSDEYTKDDVQDFALWKKASRSEELAWDSPWGKGRPGWHVECSVMAQKYLGETVDIHAGGVDLMFPHHENEIAQSEGKTGQKFVRYWVHGEHLLVDRAKMSKSANNFYTLEDLEKRGIDPLAFRYLTLTAHYRDKLNFTWKSLEAAQSALKRLRTTVYGLQQEKSHTVLSEEKIEDYRNQFLAALNDDLNTAQALAVVWEAVKSNIPPTDKYDLLLYFDKVLGLGLDKVPFDSAQGKEMPREVEELVQQREKARKAEDFAKSDNLRKQIEDKGYSVKDTPLKKLPNE